MVSEFCKIAAAGLTFLFLVEGSGAGQLPTGVPAQGTNVAIERGRSEQKLDHWGADKTRAIFRGMLHTLAGQCDRAIEDFTTLIQQEPDNFLGYAMRGTVYDQKKDFDKAIKDYTEALRLHPKDSRIHYWRAYAYCE